VTRRYKAFISYSWADKEWGGWLHRTLELYRTPRALVGRETAIGPVPPGLHPIFKDREEEAAGHGVGAAIEAALAASDFLIVICSPRSAGSEWVNREVAWFKTHKDKTRILALIVDGEPGAATRGNIAAECFPKALTHKVGADLQPTEEVEDPPLAADARNEGDGKRGAKLKLAAALLGVGLDDLVKRDERRRTIRRRLAMSGMAAGMAIFAGVALYAVSQRDAAVVARNDAVKARDDAEGIIELILTDLKQDLEGYGTLKSVTQIGNRAIGYYEGQDVKSLTPDQLGRRARVLLMLGEADNKRGDLDAALARYKTAEATTSEQLARDPGNAQRIFDHAQSVFWVGYIAWQRGDRAKAKEQFTEYHRLATQLVEIDPGKDEWLMEVGYAVNNLGILAMGDGEAQQAEAAFRAYLKVSGLLADRQPDDADRTYTRGQARAWLSDALLRQSEFAEALDQRIAEIAEYESFLARTGSNAKIDRSLPVSYTRVAQINLALGRLDMALSNALTATVRATSALTGDSNDTDRLARASGAFAVLGEVYVYLRKFDHARAALRESVDLSEKLISMDENVAEWADILDTVPKLALAHLSLQVGEHKQAAAQYESIIQSLRSQVDAATADADVVRYYCAALAGRARFDETSLSDWKEIGQRLSAAGEPDAKVLRAEASRRIGDISGSVEIVRALYASAYRHPDFMALLDVFPELKAAAEGGERRVH
jgi:tetratricopeptide (TPR) repeat protein